MSSDDDVANRKNVGAQIIVSFHLAKIGPQALYSGRMMGELRIYFRQHAGVDCTAHQCIFDSMSLR